VLLTTALPRPASEGARALASAKPALFTDVVDLLDPADLARLARHATGTASVGVVDAPVASSTAVRE
jgi:hypothetical protein